MKASNNEYPSVLFIEGTTPTSPAAGDQRLFVRSSDHVLCLVNSSGTVTPIGGASVSRVDALLGADVTMTNANTNYDGPSASFTAGTWDIWWKAAFQVANQPVGIWVKMWDGTTIYDEGESYSNLNGYRVTFGGFAPGVVLASPTTLKLTAQGDAAGQVMKRDSGHGTIHVNTRLMGLKIA